MASPPSSGLSVVCVFNDPEVRRDCLDRSLAAAVEDGSVEYLAVDNVDHQFSSAGAALNHAAHRAQGDSVVFVHQDVFLHSIEPLRALGDELRGGAWGMIGGSGITRDGTLIGAMRDRFVVTGASAASPVEVDSVDEVLFMVRRDLVTAHPLSEAPELSWHAYAVEYGLRLRGLGLRTGAADTAITHNSLTTNLAKLELAHHHVAALHPSFAPVITTCGVVGPRPSRLREIPLVRAHAWRLRWLRESRLARRAAQQLAARNTVLADIRIDLDSLDRSIDRLRVVNLDPDGGLARYATEPVELRRPGRAVVFECYRTLDEALARSGDTGSSTLWTNLDMDDLATLSAAHLSSPEERVLGIHENEVWLLTGPLSRQTPSAWSSRRAVPLLG